jgi:predicted enzyme related to lactoylglutathione lyase
LTGDVCRRVRRAGRHGVHCSSWTWCCGLRHNRQVIAARFGHVNLIARDWHRLADFYEQVFGCVSVPPERHLHGPQVSAATGVPDAVFRGVHLRLPGGGPNGPTLEIFQYEPSLPGQPTAANRPGFGHIAFVVEDVEAAQVAVLAKGGDTVGPPITTRTADGREVTWVYLTDPVGNIIELQRWSSG